MSSSDSSASAVPASPAERSVLASFLRRPLLKTLRGFRLGRLQLDLPDGTSETFGTDEGGPRARVSIRNDEFFKKCALHGNVGLGEAYLDGDWETPDIRAVIEWFIVNLHADEKARGSSQRLRLVGLLRVIDRIGHRLRPNSKRMSRRNIEEHYDLGNDFYRLWLDPTMTYSSARFTAPDQTLESAQSAKYEALCQKLKLTASDHVLEIGCGWGGFALHAATHHGCRVTGVTISPAQHAEATRRVREAGLEDRVDIRLQDYRDITGQFDKIVSIEMLEAVGDRYLETWTAKCHEVLAPGGLLAVQMITVPDCDHAELKRGTDFIQKHIFPGSLLLSIGRMNEAMNRTGNLFLHGLEDMGTSYVRTLHHWHDAFNARLPEIRTQGFPDRFIRKWNYYLKYCEAAFATRNISVVQAVFTRPVNHATLHREDGVIA
jgi:cyclopropane-fatty-acyl-phospholipid synthase